MQEYVLMCDYKDEQREITLFKDDIVEILDISKPEKWLVKAKNKSIIQVCYVPPKHLEPIVGKIHSIDIEYQSQFDRAAVKSDQQQQQQQASTAADISSSETNKNAPKQSSEQQTKKSGNVRLGKSQSLDTENLQSKGIQDHEKGIFIDLNFF